MSNHEKDFMAHDPLAWLKEEAPPPAPAAEPTEPAPDAAGGHGTPHTGITEAALAVGASPAQGAQHEAVLELSSLQVMDVAQLKPEMEQSLAQCAQLTLRSPSDIVVDGAGMQLLLAFVQQAHASGISLQWEALPPTIAEAARLLNAEQVMLLA